MHLSSKGRLSDIGKRLCVTSPPSKKSAGDGSKARAPGGLQLTPRQLECLAWVAEGKSARDIGEILGISGRTVEAHLIKVCNRLGVRTRLQAVLKARDLGLLER